MRVDACADCLRRTDLLAALSARIDVEWRERGRRPRLLALGDAELLEWGGRAETRRRYAGFDARAAVTRIAGAGLSAACRCRDGYPAGLRDLPDPPAVLHVLGATAALAGDAVAVVGARRATGYGLSVARSLGRGLAASDVTVVSGMALGIDSEAHSGALEAAAGAPTVAVLGSGADRAYPASKRSLHARIVREGGAVVSELPPGFAPLRWTFPARNRLIAALARSAIVVEATERSGSLITADFAGDLGRTVGAVPGPVTAATSDGANLLLRAGAEVIRSVQDVLDALFGAGAREAPDPRTASLRPELAVLLEAVRRGHLSVAELSGRASDPLAVAACLAELEVRGLVRRTFDGRYLAVLG